MGGGGGSGRGGLGDISPLMEKAREELRRGEGTVKRNVFLSFTYEDLDEVNLLRGQAKNDRSEIEFNDWSVREPYNSVRAEYIKQKISERISQASVTVVYVSEFTAQSQWVNWEIQESIRQGKTVVAVHKGDVRPLRLPESLGKGSIKVVSWSDLARTLHELP